jgi:hypothetical protein
MNTHTFGSLRMGRSSVEVRFGLKRHLALRRGRHNNRGCKTTIRQWVQIGFLSAGTEAFPMYGANLRTFPVSNNQRRHGTTVARKNEDSSYPAGSIL